MSGSRRRANFVEKSILAAIGFRLVQVKKEGVTNQVRVVYDVVVPEQVAANESWQLTFADPEVYCPLQMAEVPGLTRTPLLLIGCILVSRLSGHQKLRTYQVILGFP